MNHQPVAVPASNDHGMPTAVGTFDAQVGAICAQIAALDPEIMTLEQTVAALPAVLAALARHPVLWLLMGREGIDRPGTLGTIVGQQVVTVIRPDPTAIIMVGVVMLILGVLLGSGGTLVWMRAVPW